jgi:pyruvate/2-oxoglutarate dehydrogenase complex dihydrolipoamide acyltransferase (E2) component
MSGGPKPGERTVVMPPMGDDAGELILVAWLKAIGDPVRKGELLFEVETGKAIVAVEALATGVLSEILLPAGSVAAEGEPIARIAVREGAGTPEASYG